MGCIMEITNEIKVKVFAQYIGQKVSVKNETYNNGGYTGTILGVCSVRGILVEHPLGSDGDEKIDNCKLILKPLSQITDDDAYEVARILFSKEYKGHNITYSKNSICVTVMIPNTTINHSVNISFDGNLSNTNGYGLRNMLEVYQYMQSKGYDLPQHLLGGKTLQEAELATYEK